VRYDGPMLSETQFNDIHYERSFKYEDYKIEYKKFNARQYFNSNRTDPRFISIYHPTSILERRWRDALESQRLSAQFFLELENESFVLPNYDSSAHEDLFPELEERVQTKPEMEVEGTNENGVNKESKDENKIENQEQKEINEEKGEINEEKREINETITEQKEQNEISKPQRPPLIPEISHERVSKDLEFAKKIARHFDEMRNIPSNVLLGTQQTPRESKEIERKEDKEDKEIEEKETNETLKVQYKVPESFTGVHDKIKSYNEKQQLDLFIYYLMRVHFHSYYISSTFPSHDTAKIQPIYRSSEKQSEAIEETVDPMAWSDDLDKKNNNLLSVDLQIASGVKRTDEMLETFYKDKIIKDSPERYRCDVCSKMFKGPIYVKKHISVKHPEKLEEIKEKAKEEQFFRNYLSHCDRLAIQQEQEEKSREKRDENKPRIDKDKDLRERRSSKSPQRNEKRARSPIDKSVDLRRRSPSRDSSPGNDERRNNSWRHIDGHPRRGRGRGRRDDFSPMDQFELRDRLDPRDRKFKDLDKPVEDSFEIDYEKALAAFVVGDDS